MSDFKGNDAMANRALMYLRYVLYIVQVMASINPSPDDKF